MVLAGRPRPPRGGSHSPTRLLTRRCFAFDSKHPEGETVKHGVHCRRADLFDEVCTHMAHMAHTHHTHHAHTSHICKYASPTRRRCGGLRRSSEAAQSS